jgi:hypothetical protein
MSTRLEKAKVGNRKTTGKHSRPGVKVGTVLVHNTHGIGVFVGTETRQVPVIIKKSDEDGKVVKEIKPVEFGRVEFNQQEWADILNREPGIDKKLVVMQPLDQLLGGEGESSWHSALDWTELRDLLESIPSGQITHSTQTWSRRVKDNLAKLTSDVDLVIGLVKCTVDLGVRFMHDSIQRTELSAAIEITEELVGEISDGIVEWEDWFGGRFSNIERKQMDNALRRLTAEVFAATQKAGRCRVKIADKMYSVADEGQVADMLCHLMDLRVINVHAAGFRSALRELKRSAKQQAQATHLIAV